MTDTPDRTPEEIDATVAQLRRNWDRKDWWINSDEALDLGLVDEVRGAAAP